MGREERMLVAGAVLAVMGLAVPRVGVHPVGGAAGLALEAVSATASFPVVAAGVLVGVLLAGRLAGEARTLLLGIVLAGLLVFTLKEIVRAPRPPGAPLTLLGRVLEADRYSWPSGHAAFAGVLLAHYWETRHRLPLLVWALAVGASRVLLGAHYPGDVLSGLGVGVASRGLAGLAARL